MSPADMYRNLSPLRGDAKLRQWMVDVFEARFQRRDGALNLFRGDVQFAKFLERLQRQKIGETEVSSRAATRPCFSHDRNWRSVTSAMRQTSSRRYAPADGVPSSISVIPAPAKPKV